MSQFFFFLCGLFAIGGAIGVIVLRNPFYAVLSLVVHLFSLAGLFLLLNAEFVAFAQIVVYAGAVMVLYVFVVGYIGGDDESVHPWSGPSQKGVALIFAGLLFVELTLAVAGTGLKAVDSRGADIQAGFGQPAQIGELLLTQFLFVFEAASILLLVSAVGAVVLARRRGGISEAEAGRMSFTEFMRPVGTGTTAEAVGTRDAGINLPSPTTDEASERGREQIGSGDRGART
jgi:NADH:ubiquinone oxidoreductase subunit 6 (subunit J)